MVSKEMLIYSYVFTFALLLAIMTNACQYFYWHRPQQATWWGRNAPVLLLALATFFLLIAPLKNLVVNVCMASFRRNGYDETIERALDIAYMPCFKYVQAYTVVAYILMFWGTGLQVDIVGKFHTALEKRKSKKASDAGGRYQEGG